MLTLILARTLLKSGACIGGLTVDTRQSLRLCPPDPVTPWPQFQVGQLWSLTYTSAPDLVPPHLEDVIVTSALFVGEVADIPAYLEATLGMLPWTGVPDNLFDGLLTFTAGGRGYISRTSGVPSASTGFWRPDRELFLTTETLRPAYTYQSGWGTFTLPYVGLDPPASVIPAGTLTRVSLARWWKPPDRPDSEERCYLQLSGWFL